jgi:hypothetical protein
MSSQPARKCTCIGICGILQGTHAKDRFVHSIPASSIFYFYYFGILNGWASVLKV